MTVGFVVLVAFVLGIFVFGALMGYKLRERQLAARARRQVAAQVSIYRQLRELRTARQKNHPTRKDYPAQMNVRSFS
jgi:hypothetical protein